MFEWPEGCVLMKCQGKGAVMSMCADDVTPQQHTRGQSWMKQELLQEDVVRLCVYVPMCVCNQSFLECNLILSQGVTAGPTLGLIPSIHLQRHCQSVSAACQKTQQQEK